MTIGLLLGIVLFAALCVSMWVIYIHKPGAFRRRDRVIDE